MAHPRGNGADARAARDLDHRNVKHEVVRVQGQAWAHVLIVTAVGLVGLAVNFKKLQHETTVEKIIFVVGAAILACAAYLQFLR